MITETFRIEALESLIEQGMTVYANTGKLGSMDVRKLAPGRYIYEFEFASTHIAFMSEETDNHTLTTFLASIDWSTQRDNAYCREMEVLLGLSVWSSIDEHIIDAVQDSYQHLRRDVLRMFELIDNLSPLKPLPEEWKETQIDVARALNSVDNMVNIAYKPFSASIGVPSEEELPFFC